MSFSKINDAIYWSDQIDLSKVICIEEEYLKPYKWGKRKYHYRQKKCDKKN